MIILIYQVYPKLLFRLHIELIILIFLKFNQAQHLAQDVDSSAPTSDEVAESDDHTSSIDDELRQMLTSILVDNGVLRKQVNTLIMHSLKTNKSNDTECKADVNVGNEI